MVLVFDETAAAETAADLIEAIIMSGDPAVEPFKTLQANRAKRLIWLQSSF